MSVRQVDISTELQSAVCSLRGQTPAVRDRKNARVPARLTHIPRREFRPARANVPRFSRPTTITEIEDVRLPSDSCVRIVSHCRDLCYYRNVCSVHVYLCIRANKRG